jgi:hypothetical protein
MFALDNSQVWSVDIGCIVFGVLLIAVAVGILFVHLDWKAIRELPANAKAENPFLPIRLHSVLLATALLTCAEW